MSDARPGPTTSNTVAKVTRAQVKAAQLKIEINRRQGKETPDWIRRVAAAKPSRTT